MRNYFEELVPMPSTNYFTSQYLVRLWDTKPSEEEIKQYADSNIYTLFHNYESCIYNKDDVIQAGYDFYNNNSNAVDYGDKNEVLIKYIDDHSYKYDKVLYDNYGKKIELLNCDDEDYAIQNDYRVTQRSLSESFTVSSYYKEINKIPDFQTKAIKSSKYEPFYHDRTVVFPHCAHNSKSGDKIGSKDRKEIAIEVESVLVNNPTSNINIFEEILAGYGEEMYKLGGNCGRYHIEYGSDYIKNCVEKMKYTLDIYKESRDELRK